MSAYGVRDVERLLHVSRATIRDFIRKGFVTPGRGPRRAYQFSFRDLIVLRTARALHVARVPAKRISRSMAELRRMLPETLPLSGLQISAVGERVVVREGVRHWQAETGQYLLALDVHLEGGVLQLVDRAPEVDNADEWFRRGLDLEDTEPRSAAKSYEIAVQLDPRHLEAWINQGRLLHALGELSQAEHIYRDGLRACGRHALLFFNLGVALEDAGRSDEALDAYREALTEDADLADGHFNLARLHEQRGELQAAIRHIGRYRRLTQP